MEVPHPRCASQDVHESLPSRKRGMPSWPASATWSMAMGSDRRSFKTTTKGLMALSEWPSVEGRAHIVMEATGVYWPRGCIGHGGVLEAGPAHSRGWRVRIGAGERGARQGRAGPQDRRRRCHLAGRTAGARAGPAGVSRRIGRPRRRATCRAPASSSRASAAGTSSGSRRRWKTPISSSTRSSPTSWACPAVA